MDAVFEFKLLGPLEARHGGVPIPIRAAKQRVLLAALLVDANRPVSNGELFRRLWGGNWPAGARATLHSYVMRLRRVLSADGASAPIMTEPDGYRIVVADDALDLLRFQALLREAAGPAASADPEFRAALLAQALGLWNGDPLSNVASETLHRQAAPVWAEQRLTALELRIDADLEAGRGPELLPELRELTTRHPLRERFHAQLMLAYYRAQRQAEALAAYQDARRLLADELGTDPGPALRHLHQQILTADPALTRPGWSALSGAAPPAADDAARKPDEPAISTPPHPTPRELPADIADFTGRSEQVGRIVDLLTSTATAPTATAHAVGATAAPVLVICGPGGIGKTTLAVHAAHLLREHFPDGQLYACLHGVDPTPLTPGEALARFLRSLGIRDQDMPIDEDERGTLYRSLLADRSVLITLDNARDAAQVRPLLPGGAGCAVLATSRDQLAGLDGAQRLDLDVLDPGEALSLLTRSIGADRTSAEPQATDAVLAACAGLPLAIRIAAARLVSRPDWTLAAYAGLLADRHRRLDELRSGDRAIRAGFEVSYAALPAPVRADDPDAARAFRLLSLAEGADLSLPAGAALLGQPSQTASEAVGALVQAQLLQSSDAGRYRYHDLLRLYASELADRHETQAERAAAVERVLTWYARAASAAMDVLHPYERHRRPSGMAPADPAPPIHDQETARAWLTAEHANLLAAAEQAARHGLPALTVNLSMILTRHLVSTGRHNDALVLHGHALAAARRAADVYGQGRALGALGLTHWWLGRNREAADELGSALALFREHGDRADEGSTLMHLGLVYRSLGRYPQAQEHYLGALAIARETGNVPSQANALGNLGNLYRRVGRYEEADDALHQALSLQREVGSYVNECIVLLGLGGVYTRLGRHDEALDYIQSALDLAREHGDRTGELQALDSLAAIELDTGRLQPALDHLRTALALAAESGSSAMDGMVLITYGRALTALGEPAAAVKQHERALAVARETGDDYHQAVAIEGIADALYRLGDADAARERWREALARYARLGVPEAEAVRAKLG
jgi:DNA-binding SARP family transcriptional activator/Tfp pilus assembly protein PilF